MVLRLDTNETTVTGTQLFQTTVNQELEDVGSAVGAINQTYYYTLASGKKGEAVGSTNLDFQDACDNSCDINCDSPARGEK